VDPIKIESGLIAGRALPNSVKEYLGVPWEGVYQANRFGNKCPQTADLTPEGMSEG